ncbi:ComEA family DNA-binding protein [Pseudomonas fragi]|uniref:Helix-hairpin-helix domain-containing protein n=1 Tax=Pseudomonas fragi TaxID=296 RepID=A0A9Q5AZI5_PSEFR|nr:helix-hairpin-helix domain-containing protein [Pseudomonas fragi]NNB49502.1 helix-hairpin-helix domain-containing protein [Pseudomonas fragi]
MRTAFLSSIFFALMVGVSSVAHAAPAAGAVEPVVAAPVVLDAKVVTININTADEARQRELSGVGAVKAKAIVAYREANGDFTSVDELLEVKGIGKVILERNRDKIVIS